LLIRRILCLVAVLLTAHPVFAMQVAMPDAARVLAADLVVIATIDGDGVKHARTLQLPRGGGGVTRWFHDTRVNVEEVLFVSARVGTVDRGKALPLTVWAEKPLPPQKPGQLRPLMADGPAYPELRDGRRYLLLLRKLPDEAGYMAQPGFADVRLLDGSDGSKAWLARMRKAANIEKWAWGAPVDGLQIAFVPDATEICLHRYRPAGKTEQVRAERLMFTTVMRNVSDRPITVNLYPQDEILVLLDGGQAVAAYTAQALREQTFDAAKHLYRLQAGELLSIARYGKAVHGDGVQPDGRAVPRVYSMRYSSTRAGAWQGMLKSGVVNIQAREGR
jgi:hypothetical protein